MEQSVAKEVFEVRTPEEIKKGLEYCSEKAKRKTNCSECIYFNDPRGWCSTVITKDALDYIQQLEAQQPRWISVGERLPENGQKIIAAFSGSSGWVVDQARYAYGEFDFASWVNVLGDNITHWMPMPHSPEEERK